MRITPSPISNLKWKLDHLPLSKQAIRTRYLGHVTDYQPIRHQYFPVKTIPTISDDPILRLENTTGNIGRLVWLGLRCCEYPLCTLSRSFVCNRTHLVRWWGVRWSLVGGWAMRAWESRDNAPNEMLYNFQMLSVRPTSNMYSRKAFRFLITKTCGCWPVALKLRFTWEGKYN